MRFSDIAVRRPVFAAVLSLLIIAFGIISFTRLPLREYPNIDIPVVSVDTNYTGAAAEVIESRITQLIEGQISGVEGVKSISSASRDGRSDITIEFDISRNIDDAANDVRDRVSRVLDNLPEEADPPEVNKVDTDAQPIIFLSLTSNKHSLLELADYAERYLVDRFSATNGVARVQVYGSSRPALRIWLNRERLAAYQLTTADVERALRTQNVELPAGRIESTEQNLTLRINRPYVTPEDFTKLIIGRGANGYLVRMGDIAQVELGQENPYTFYHNSGKPAVGLAIVRQSNANTVEVAEAIRNLVPEVARTLPDGMSLFVNYDTSVFISESISKVYHTLGEAAVLVVVVIFLFLGSMRATLMPAVAVPISLTGAFILLAALGYSLNLLTLLALVLAIGLVVDDAIVVLENVYHRIEKGEPPLLAAYNGAGQVSFAVIASTVVVMAVFVPVLFLGGNVGRLFRELAAAMIGAVGVSLIVSLTLTPMMCSKMLKGNVKPNRFNRKVDEYLNRLGAAYRRSLDRILDRWVLMGLACVAVFGLTIFGLMTLKSELAPEEDTGMARVTIVGPEGMGFDALIDSTLELEKRLMEFVGGDKPVERFIVRAPSRFGSSGDFTSASASLVLKDWGNRDIRTQDVIQQLQARLDDMPNVRAFANQNSSLGGGRGRPISFVISGSSFEELARARDAIIAAAATYPGIQGLDSDYKETKPQMQVHINTTRAADLGVPVADIGATLETMMGSRRVTTYIDRGEEYYVVLQAQREHRLSPSDLENMYVRSTTTQKLIPLSNLVSLDEFADAGTLGRYNRLRAITLEGNVGPGFSLGEALSFLENEALKHPEVVAIGYKGESREFKEAGSALIFALIFAIVVIYLVLAAQFESFIHPIVIILTVPLAVGGAALGLHLLGATLNIFSQVGIVMLVGLATKNGILIVEFANQLRDEGHSIRNAILSASERRLRPILMTSIATVAGAVPLVIMGGAGAASRQSIGTVIVFGVSLSTVLSLYVIPVIYNRLARYTRSPEAVTRDLEAQMASQTVTAEAAE
ncbi:efflux RND transporter permease subunit [Pedomonas mirosovicensis]|uniref:efflux RND transporter permease subunit n=1 Tax=Pedomonas mirosovicensis TaxID=2908641 RepID=UPI0021692262|nr:efflux RND transporter permease subunit [Pedomonas mirosovicensis]MCH8685445.1 efflux RND transporter permease subunit [Pedomonas mirosovicensis]